jgi:predicted MFS family arabinose efflux permease
MSSPLTSSRAAPARPALPRLTLAALAAAVAFGGPAITVLAARARPGRSIAALLAAFVACNALAALSPSLAWLLAFRVPGGALMGALFALSTVAATRAAPPGREGAALGMISIGLTASLVAGAPLGNALAQVVGWRSCFWLIAAVALAAGTGIVATGRRLGTGAADARDAGQAGAHGTGLRAVARPQVRGALATTALVVPAVFCAYTYLTPVLAGITGLGPGGITLVLLVLGIAAMAGSALGGRALDARAGRWLSFALAGVTVSLAMLAAGAHSVALAGVGAAGFGFSAFACVPVLQGRAIAAAGGDNPVVAAGLNISAFNLANTIGAGLGGGAVTVSGSPRAALWLGTGLALLAWLILRLRAGRAVR